MDKRCQYYDYLNLFACFAVVAMHVNSAFWDYRPNPSWLLNSFIEKSCVWAVPIFYMLTGATLIRSSESFSFHVYAQKRFSRTVLPFIFWSFVGLIYDIFYLGSVSPDLELANYVSMILNASIPTTSVFWFFLPLFAIYLALPLLIYVDDEKKKKVFGYLIFAYLILNLIRNLFGFFGISFPVDLQLIVMGGWLIYPILGWYLSNIELRDIQQRGIYLIGIISFLFTWVGTVISSYKAGSIVNVGSNLLDLPYIIISSSVFLFFKQRFARKSQSERGSKLLVSLSGLTFGVYLIHRFVLNFLVKLLDIQPATWYWPIIGFFLVSGISFLLVALIKRIPLLRRLV